MEAKPEKKNERSNLETHNGIVLGYADELVRQSELSEEDKAAVYLAVILHDSGKLASGLIEHHLKSLEYAEPMLDELPAIKQDGEIIEITPELKEKVLQAIERHMNHPFLVLMNKGKRFPEPENEVDKIVFDADMLSQAGFKNVCFRLTGEGFFREDIAAASKKGIPTLEETFNNVMAGVKVLDEVVLTGPAKERIKELVDATVKIFEHLKANQALKEIQDKYSKDGEYNFQTVKESAGGIQALKKDLNQAIMSAAEALGIEQKVVKNLIM